MYSCFPSKWETIGNGLSNIKLLIYNYTVWIFAPYISNLDIKQKVDNWISKTLASGVYPCIYKLTLISTIVLITALN